LRGTDEQGGARPPRLPLVPLFPSLRQSWTSRMGILSA
jgi:hypothetical protein